ncbi:MAG: hypothetical protein JWP94_15 [Mucilaginibacter sp.]|nr:hypothetical protein [Mucilaginibacter sp.]
MLRQRLLSLDFMRGFIMTVLMLGETGFFNTLDHAYRNVFLHRILQQFEHTPWHGLRFWDILLPAFMLIAGTSMAYSYRHQKHQLKYTWFEALKKIAKRSLWLLFWGVLIYAVKGGKLNIELTNVLVQLAFTTFISFFFINLPARWQIMASFAFLTVSDLLFRLISIPHFDKPFIRNANFGSYLDMIVLRNVDSHHYTNTVNFISSTALTLWGITVGQLFMSNRPRKSLLIAAFGTAILFTGLILDFSNINPILKWISSASFVLATGGITLIFMALCYEWIDIRNHRRYITFFVIVGMNSLFIYLFFSFLGFNWLYHFAAVIITGILALINIPLYPASACACLLVFALEWHLCYFLYKRNIFFKA